MRSALSTTLWSVAFHCASGAFAPIQRPQRTATALFARRVLPPAPPPPPTLDSSDVLGGLLSKLQESTDALKETLSTVPKLDLDLPNVDWQSVDLSAWTLPLQQARQYLNELTPFIRENYPEILPHYETFLTALQPVLDNPLTPPAVIVASALVVRSMLAPKEGMGPQQPYPTGRYDPASAKTYFDRRPQLVLARGLQVVTRSLAFAATVAADYLQERNGGTGLPEEQVERRGRELAALLVQLGSTYIKVGQSLSIRTDLLSPSYIRGLQTLQDQVPPFDSDRAFEMIEEEWGRPLDQIVSKITPVPVASASLGQVYKATLKGTDMEVAIKVQRPDIMEQIALDMYLLREYIAPTVKKLGNLNSDTVGTVDAWGLGFVDELNYIQEAKNAQFFNDAIAKTPLKEVVFSPKVVREHSTKRVLVTEWVNGERLDKSSKEDVTTLCSIAMNTYLTMLLEIGMLHCDPHPGNLLRTPDGKLAVLDWGMITLLDPDLQLTLIEHMAHLTSADYDEIPRDLLLLGFIPQEKAHLINDSGVVEVLAGIYGTWTGGGGVAAFNVNDVINDLQDLTSKKGNLFQIPPYFAYIAKSFSVLEGIGLTNDPKYSIIKECLPYISQRLLTDSKSMSTALNTFIFGAEKNSEYRIVDIDRVEQLVTGFGDYTTSSSGALLGKENISRTELLENAADQLLDLVFTEEETPLQGILLEQMAKMTAATSRSIWTEIRERSGTLPSGRTLLGTLVDPIGLWRTSPLVRMNELDEKIVDTTRRLLTLAQKQAQSSSSGRPELLDLTTLNQGEVIEISAMLVRKVWAKRGGVWQTGRRFATKLLELTADKLERGERDTRKLPVRAQSSKLDTPFAESLSRQSNHESSPPLLKDPTFRTDLPVRTTPRVEIARQTQTRKPTQGSSSKSPTPVQVPVDSPQPVPDSPRLVKAKQRLAELLAEED